MIMSDLSVPRNMYPHLKSDVSLHISPSYGLILCGNPPKPLHVSKDTVEILTGCNGTQTFDDILTNHVDSDNRGDNLKILEAIVTLARLIREGMIILDKQPSKVEPQVTGSRTIFYPTSIQIELTTACNLRCSYCYRKSGPNEPEDRLATSRLLEILVVLLNNGLHSVELTGGEPLLHPNFVQIVNFCGERFSLIGLLTNGTLITESLLDKLLPFRDKMVVSVSLDSHIPTVHDARRGRRGAFDKTANAIRLLSQQGFLTRVSMSVDQHNWKDIESTLLLARQLGASMFTYSPILPFGRAEHNFGFWSYEAEEVLQTEKQLAEKYKGFLHFLPEDTTLEIHQPGGCGAGHRVYAMDPRGLVRPCVTFDENQAIFGSLAKQSPADVFSRKLSSAFAMIEPPHPDVCGSCKWALFCQHCSLRGLMASQWVGEEKCMWLNQPKVRQWSNLVRDHTFDND